MLPDDGFGRLGDDKKGNFSICDLQDAFCLPLSKSSMCNLLGRNNLWKGLVPSPLQFVEATVLVTFAPPNRNFFTNTSDNGPLESRSESIRK